jgi:hypothetical protein
VEAEDFKSTFSPGKGITKLCLKNKIKSNQTNTQMGWSHGSSGEHLPSMYESLGYNLSKPPLGGKKIPF